MGLYVPITIELSCPDLNMLDLGVKHSLMIICYINVSSLLCRLVGLCWSEFASKQLSGQAWNCAQNIKLSCMILKEGYENKLL